MPNTAAIPDWVQAISALGTPTLAAIVAMIAWGQWRVAKRKLVLDLFEKRLEVFNQIESVISQFSNKTIDYAEYESASKRLFERARFMFGGEVSYYLSNLNAAIHVRDMAMKKREGFYPQLPEYVAASLQIERGEELIRRFTTDFYLVCRPFLLMDQRNPTDIRVQAQIKIIGLWWRARIYSRIVWDRVWKEWNKLH